MIPRWRGFNLLDMFTMQSRGDFPEDDFKWIRDFEFDFVRFPAGYRFWIVDGDDRTINEAMLARLDQKPLELLQNYGAWPIIGGRLEPGLR